MDATLEKLLDSPRFIKERDGFFEAMRNLNASRYQAATCLTNIRAMTGDHFVTVLSHERGLNLNPYEERSARELVDLQQHIPNSRVWDALPLTSLRKVTNIGVDRERNAVIRAVVRSYRTSGESRPVSKDRLSEIIEQYAPSYVPKTQNNGESKIRVLREENDGLCRNLAYLLENVDGVGDYLDQWVVERAKAWMAKNGAPY